ncbi:lysylphosphatidylglycerol synthase transmembrane domain-containing protein [Psychroserpens ponticola]|uniref:Lysylphosphatidylglycerol synthase transmembrane domain-containing protein n=1 Tax=Psychroserpens ponticola TaxID=2932268 RepID=A0ABY7RZ08_9FLAO|nr:lysylphosphatidylglycerol synthase transmembrane domain-containing protein [Psychroserpens ponticola]WCO01471.1 lysylphosphatidylglycerol synthase transmembrane domain-containing protein [Psychroserpens ponticola]
MSPKHKKRLRLIIPLALAIFFGWYTFSKLPVSTIIPYVKSANYWWIGLGIFIGLLSHMSRAYRWQYLLEPLGYQIKLPNSIMAVFITYLANYGIPRSGEVLRAAVLTNYEDVPFEKSFGTIVAERMADLLVMLFIIAITLVLEFDFIIELLEKSFQPKKLIVFGCIGLGFVAIIFLYIKRSQSKFALKVKRFLKGLVEGMLSIFKMKHKWAFIAHTLFIWGMYILMFYVTTFALPELDQVSIGAILVAFISASFTIAATNGGIFVYPAAVMAAFTVFGIAKDPSFAFGWIMWSSQTIMIIIAGSLSFIYLPIYNRKE